MAATIAAALLSAVASPCGRALRSKGTRGRCSCPEQSCCCGLGPRVNCTDGVRGEVRGLVIDPADDSVTHLVAEERHRQGLGQLVPFGQVTGATAEAVQLGCTTAEFDQFEAWPTRRSSCPAPGATRTTAQSR